MIVQFAQKDYFVEFTRDSVGHNTQVRLVPMDPDDQPIETTALTRSKLTYSMIAVEDAKHPIGLTTCLHQAGIIERDPLVVYPILDGELPIYELTYEANAERIKQFQQKGLIAGHPPAKDDSDE